MAQGFSRRGSGLFLFYAVKIGSLLAAPCHCWAVGFDRFGQGMFVAWKAHRSLD
jgi:hypothetical protein